MASLNIRVGASVDRNLQTAYKPVVDAAKRAAAAIEAENKRSARAIVADTKRAEREKERAYRETERAAARWQKEALREMERTKKQEIREHEKAEKEKTRATEREERERSRIAAQQARAAAQHARAAAQQARANERQMARARSQEIRERNEGINRLGRGLSGLAVSGGRAALRGAMNAAGTVARASGVETNVESILGQNVSLETLATKLANQGLNVGSADARNRVRQDPRALMQQALQVGAATGTDSNAVLEGLTKFADVTGDLAGARDVLKDMAILSKATGTELDDMLSAAGQVQLAFGDAANKAELTNVAMRAFAGQGKVGAVEIKDLASSMAKIASQAGQFEGDIGNTLVTLGALGQEARQRGGASTATQAANTVQQFVGMLKTPKRAQEFERATGTKVFNEKTGMLRDPQVIIKEALSKVGMDPIKLKQIFQNVQGGRAIEGFATLYRQAGGGAAGGKAVDDEFDRLRKAAISSEEITASFERAMRSTTSQTEAFNQQMRAVALDMQGVITPALLSLAPAAIGAAKTMASLASFVFGDRTTQTITSGASADVNEALTSLDKQLPGGKISTATRAAATEAERRAFEAKARTAAELQTARESASAKPSFMGQAISATANGLLGSASGWWNLGKAGAEIALGGDKKGAVTSAEAKDKQMAELFEKIHSKNDEVARLLAGKLIVEVSNVDELKAANASNTGEDGRQPSPEMKARAR